MRLHELIVLLLQDLHEFAGLVAIRDLIGAVLLSEEVVRIKLLLDRVRVVEFLLVRQLEIVRSPLDIGAIEHESFFRCFGGI